MEKKAQRLANLIRNARRLKRLSQEQVADQSGVPRGWLSVVELGKVQQPDAARLSAVAQVIGLSDDLLLSMAGHPTTASAKPRPIADLIRELYARLNEIPDSEPSVRPYVSAPRMALALR